MMVIKFIQTAADSACSKQYGVTEVISVAVQALTALGTILLALIALYGERVKRWLFRPKLQVLAGETPPFLEPIKETRAKSGNTSIFTNIKLKVVNLGSTTAPLCQGLVQHIYSTRMGSDTFFNLRTIVPTPLLWSNNMDNYTTVSTVIPSYIELAKIQGVDTPSENNESPSNEEREYALFLSVEEPGTKGQLIKLGKGTFIVPITFIADDATKAVVFIKIFWNGNDAAQMESSNFYVKVLASSDVPKEVEV